MPRRSIALVLGVAASATLFVSLADGAVSPQDTQLRRACVTAANRIANAVIHAATTQVQVITVPFRVVAAGTLIGRIAFNPSGSRIGVAGDAPSTGGLGCATGAIGPGVPKGPGHSQVVSTLRRTFTAPGRHTLRFELGASGRRILARLGAADRAYRKQHPHGQRPPSIAFGVSLSYTPAG
ncbi:MAG: hypothetical protein JO130_17700 [Solirubrobacterales bacterium]|nr:hypothetical protein [Solirubrobacterales bacterium]